MWWSSNHWSTPICARPNAPPPSRATPIFRRFFVAAEESEAWGNTLRERRKHSAITANKKRERLRIGYPWKTCVYDSQYKLGQFFLSQLRSSSPVNRYSDTPVAGKAFSLPNSSSTACQALGSFLVANGAPRSA